MSLIKKADDPCLPLHLEMVKFKDETNWVNEVLGLRKKLQLSSERREYKKYIRKGLEIICENFSV